MQKIIYLSQCKERIIGCETIHDKHKIFHLCTTCISHDMGLCFIAVKEGKACNCSPDCDWKRRHHEKTSKL